MATLYYRSTALRGNSKIRGFLAVEYQHPKLIPKMMRLFSPTAHTGAVQVVLLPNYSFLLPHWSAWGRGAGRGAAGRLLPNLPVKNRAGWEVSTGRVWCKQTRSQGMKVIFNLFLSENLVVIWASPVRRMRGGSCEGRARDVCTLKLGSPEHSTSHATLPPLPSHHLPILPFLRNGKPFPPEQKVIYKCSLK